MMKSIVTKACKLTNKIVKRMAKLSADSWKPENKFGKKGGLQREINRLQEEMHF